MALVVYNGIQLDDSRLPAHVDPKQCVPLEEWRRANRKVATRPRADRPSPVSAKASGRSKGKQPAPADVTVDDVNAGPADAD